MNILYDGMSNPTGLITLTNVPNILTIESDSVTGSKSELTIFIYDLNNVDLNQEYYLTINDITINSSTTQQSRSFWVTNNNDTQSKNSVAASIVKALRASNLVGYDIFQMTSLGFLTNAVVIRSKEIGEQYNIKYSTNFTPLSFSNKNGSTTDELNGSKINIDIYSRDEYVTSLEKSYYKDKIDFNLSNILSSITEYDYLTPYRLSISKEKDGLISTLGYISNLYSTIGYMVNQGDKYLLGTTFAQNVNRGSERDVYNKTVLYTYLPEIPIGIYGSSSLNISINYLDSSKETIREDSYNFIISNGYAYHTIYLDSEQFNQAHYIDLVIPQIGTIRYNVIKPLDATSYCQRIWYHNSYGGISFFDFTGERTENHTTENDTYSSNIFDYYRSDTLEQEKIYNKQNKIVVTIKSHLMDNDAKWQFSDMLQSYDVWTEINGQKYKIIISTLKVDPTDTDVYQATMTYTYSLL